jgi:16S rRNA (uracil1498-N3)-methyltransferase
VSLFYLPDILEGANHFNDEESTHILKVLRMQPGDALTIADGKGTFYQAKIVKAESKKCVFEIVAKNTVPKKDYSIHIAIAPTKSADRIEWFVEKTVEMGINEISFFYSQNSERRTINRERIEKIAISALKQSLQAWLPKINLIRSFKEIIHESAEQNFIGFVDSSNPIHLKSAAIPQKNYLTLIGPEGDFTEEELASALENGFEKICLGSNRLRTETAGLVACQVLQFVNT